MLSVQRSIPFPRISLTKLINYILFVGENPGVDCTTIKERGLDIGKGRGDITRFFQRIGLISIEGNCSVRLTDVGNTLFKALSSDVSLAKILMHLILYSELPYYRLLVDTVGRYGSIGIEELHEEVNQRIKELSPTAWLNEVAYKALIGLAVDLDVIEVEGNRVNIKYVASVSECIRGSMVSVGGQRILRTDDLVNCLRRTLTNLDAEALISNVSVDGCAEPIVAPSRVNSRMAYLRVLNEDCVIRQVVNAILKAPLNLR